MFKAAFILFIMVSAFLLEWLLLLLLNFIGLEAREKNREDDRLVAVTFGFMGIAGALSIGLLMKFGIGMQAHYSWAITLIACVLVANVAVTLTSRRVIPAPSV
jgi:hypothetical protein